MNDKPKQPDDDEMLESFGLAHLPQMFAMRDGNNVIQESAPCYQCRGEVVLGEGKGLTWYEEGTILVVHSTPNDLMEPLNRAAALNWVRWQVSLPIQGADVGVDDIAEAAHTLAKNPKSMELDQFAWNKAVSDLAYKMKMKRLGKDARTLPHLGSHNFAPQSGGNAPPLVGAKVADMAQRGPGSLHAPGPRDTSVRRAGTQSNTAGGNALGGPAPL